MTDSLPLGDLVFKHGPAVVIVGVGLMGGSIGMALKTLPNAPRVIGLGRNPQRLQKAIELKAIDSFTTNWGEAIAEAGLVVLCGPVSSIASGAEEAWAFRKTDELLITDAGSTKGSILATISKNPQLAAAFVGGHPIAGSEKSGVEAARADLFRDRLCIVTPTRFNPPENIARVRQFWQKIGSRVVEMPPDEHDQALALTSHLPHLLSAALSRLVDPGLHQLSAGAFRDMTRIAGADADLWRDIFLSNKNSVRKSLEEYINELLNFKKLLDNDDSEALSKWWDQGRRHRKSFESPAGN
ncbi:MAG: prephenate dehydrogenase [bacterium]